MRKQQWIYEIFAYLLALLFLFTAASKLFDLRHFVREINNQPFDDRFTPALVYGLPAIELIAVALLVWPKMRLKGFYLSAVLMFVFTVYVALVTFHFYNRVPCACATAFKHLSWPEHLAMNVVFLTLSITGIILHHKEHHIKIKQPYPIRAMV
ncbi:MauE/DoxX family redox-associated membrane protein [Mucilaginibacter paludis]|uniref:Methylamine utilisation protein MauE domain-containing protein n=1 Tax=Mucilaginibacter paludis DSM 18603 TaxID=714943 RepID=H1Y403_9SPHI|nr:MauE/DoxX family redox-associated membrane protein [Mucilaginibacter paludis]EHQ30948.1 hypothetical protein Mucpa_6899 [Mucilaginibacter paludis DSM 18603]